MATNGTEKAELFPHISYEIENGKNSERIKDINGSIKEPLSEGDISNKISILLRWYAIYRRVGHTLFGSLILNGILCAIIIVLSALLLLERRTQELLPVYSIIPVDYCPDGWVGYRRKCYYFAEAERNWTFSLMSCASFNASLAVVDSQEEMDFLLRYKTSADHWIGLQRDIETEPWKWVNGTLFNNWFQIRGGGECAYLNYKGAASSFCTREEPWICSKPVNRCQKSTF